MLSYDDNVYTRTKYATPPTPSPPKSNNTTIISPDEFEIFVPEGN